MAAVNQSQVFKAWTVWLFLLLPALHAPIAEATCRGGTGLNALAEAVLKSRFPGWKVVTLADLDSYEREAWQTVRPGRCPGVVWAKVGPRREGYAVTLFKPLGGDRHREMLVLLTKTTHGYSPIIVFPDSEEDGGVGVVWIAPAGVYEEVESDRKVKTAWPVMMYETIGAGIMACYWDHGSFKSLLISE